MKKLFVSVLALVLLGVAAVPARADTTPGWYAGAGAGASLRPESYVGAAPPPPAPPVNSSIEYNPGWVLLVDAGYAWSNGIRVEGEFAHSRSSVDKIEGGTNSSGHLSTNDFFANAYYDFHTGTRFTPYVGAGAGVSLVDADHIGTLANGNVINDTQPAFAYQAIAGVAAQLDPNWAVTADYRYVASLAPRFATSPSGTDRTENESHNIILSVRYSFGQPPEPAPMRTVSAPHQPAETAVAASPEAVAVPESYTVFFDFDQATLTPEAERILASAAQEFKRSGYVRIVVTGHTDTVGTVPYNQGLSERRAKAVSAALIKLGVDAKSIQSVGVGKNGLLVPTEDQIREAQNRRAEIVLKK